MTVKIIHAIKSRVRFRFEFNIDQARFQLMEDSFYYCFPNYTLRQCNQGYGCVVTCSNDSTLIADELKNWLMLFFKMELVQGPCSPPTLWQLRRKKLNHILIQMMMFFAIMGWILPIMPGTPFFLIAWSMGWRPPNSKHTIDSVQN